VPASCATRSEFLAIAPEFSSYGPTSSGQVVPGTSTPGDRFFIRSASNAPAVLLTFTAVAASPVLGSEYLAGATSADTAESLTASINAAGQLATASISGNIIYLDSIQTGVDGLHTISDKPEGIFTLVTGPTLVGGAALIDQALACACSQINLECWGAKAQCAHVYLTAHTLTVANGGEAGPVNRRKIDKIEESFAAVGTATGLDPSFATTRWGRLYLQLKQSLFVAPVAGRRFLVSPNTLRGWRGRGW
jgi:hypothetical protein